VARGHRGCLQPAYRIDQRQNVHRLRRGCFVAIAVERQFEIVGEALRVALLHQPELAANITDARAIVAFRNQLTHAYSAVDHPTVWGLLERRVPQLRTEVTRLLEALADEKSSQ
jgi:uncharacterized protein with HEPN domain